MQDRITTKPECPPWCTDDSGHDVGDATTGRCHTTMLGTFSDGLTHRVDVSICGFDRGNDPALAQVGDELYLTARQARDFAALLEKAAARLDEIGAGQIDAGSAGGDGGVCVVRSPVYPTGRLRRAGVPRLRRTGCDDPGDRLLAVSGGGSMSAARADHGIALEGPAGDTAHRTLCLCGWTSPWLSSRRDAYDHGKEHLVVTTAALREILEQVVRGPELAEALAELPPAERAEIRRTLAVTLGERFIRETLR